MKKLTLLIAAGLLFAPLLSPAGEPLELKPVPKEATSSNLNFYVATNFLLGVVPGIRWQSGHWGADLSIALLIEPLCGVWSVNGNALYYFNPKDTTKHYLSLGVSTFPLMQQAYNKKSDLIPVVPSIAYGFQKSFKSSGYLFMNFGIFGPLRFKVREDQRKSLHSEHIPLPFINLGYAF